MNLFKHTFLMLLICSRCLLAQEPQAYTSEELYFQTFTTKDGLPSQNTYNTYQDQHGFLWISTAEGLTRYDGYAFKPYLDNVKTGLRLKGACGFYEDDKGTLWVISGLGFLHKYDRKTDRFVPIKTPLEDGWDIAAAHSIIPDQLGNLWISSHGGIQYFNTERNSIKLIDIEAIRRPESWPHNEKVRIGPMYLQEGKALWMGTIKFGFIKFDLHSEELTFYRFDPRFNRKFLDDWIGDIVPLDNKTLLIADKANGLLFWDMEEESIKDIIHVGDLLPSQKFITIHDIEPLTKDLYWLATEEAGIILFDIQTRNIVEHYQPDGQLEMAIDGAQVNHISFDQNGSLWLGSNSLQLCSSQLQEFNTYLAENGQSLPLPNNEIFAIEPTEDGHLLISTTAGITSFNPLEETFSYPLLDMNPGEKTWGILQPSESEIWVSTENYLHQYDKQTSKIIHSFPNNLIVDDQNNWLRIIYKIIADDRGHIWMIDHWGRLKYINPDTNEAANVFELAQDSISGKFVNVLDIIDDPANKQIIVGLDIGLALVSYDRKVTRPNLEHNDENLARSVYSYFYRDDDQNIWGIIHGKVYQYDPNDQSIVLLDLNDRYQIAAFRWIVEEPTGIFWLASHRGIIRYDKATEQSSLHYTKNIGGATLNSPSPVAELDGKIYFSGYKGLSVIDPLKMSSSMSPNDVVITDIFVNGSKHIIEERPNRNTELNLRYYENDIDIALSNFTFVAQQDCKYRYRLLPQDEEWVDHGSDHTLAFYNLLPDDYMLEISASGNDGQWSEQILQMEIHIKSAWWDTTLARSLFFLLLIGSILYYQRLRYLNKLVKQQEMEVLRNKISKDLHDDVGTVLTGIAMQSELLEDFVDDNSKPIAEQIAVKSRQAMERMRDTVWAIDSRRDSMLDLKDRMLDFIEDNLPNKEISFDLQSDIFSESQKIAPNARQAAYLIFKESIVNIMKHSDTSTIQISLSTSKDQLRLHIQDQGSKKEKLKTSGQGLSNMKSRAEETGGEYKFEYQDGYRTSLILPIS